MRETCADQQVRRIQPGLPADLVAEREDVLRLPLGELVPLGDVCMRRSASPWPWTSPASPEVASAAGHGGVAVDHELDVGGDRRDRHDLADQPRRIGAARHHGLSYPIPSFDPLSIVTDHSKFDRPLAITTAGTASGSRRLQAEEVV